MAFASKHTGVQIRQVDLPRLTRGVLHTKFWIVDQLHIYLGSANMDWRALTQVMPSCSACLAFPRPNFEAPNEGFRYLL